MPKYKCYWGGGEQEKIKFDDTLGALLDIPLNHIDKGSQRNNFKTIRRVFRIILMKVLWMDYPN